MSSPGIRYDHVVDEKAIQYLKKTSLLGVSGFSVEMTSFDTGNNIDRLIKLPSLPKTSTFINVYLQVPSDMGESFKNLGGTITVQVEGKGKAFGGVVVAESLRITSDPQLTGDLLYAAIWIGNTYSAKGL